MRIRFPFLAATAAGLLVCLSAPAAMAQPSFSLEEPVLVADGQPISVQGAPLQQQRFGALVLAVPGVGTYTISDRQFEGSRLAGQFDGDGLYFASEGVSVRLRGRAPILGPGRRDAYVRTSAAAGAGGPARVALATAQRAATQRATSRTARGPARPEPVAADAGLRAEVERLRAQVVTLAEARQEAARQSETARRSLQATLDRVTAERDALRSERDRAIADRRSLAAEMEQTRREAERAAERGRTAAAERATRELARLRAEVVSRDESIAVLTTERDERGTQVARLTTELERVNGLLLAARSERDLARTELDAARNDLATLRSRPAPEAEEAAALRTEVARLTTALAEVRAERDRLAALTSVQAPELASGEAEIDRLQAEIADARQRLADSDARLRESDAARGALQTEADRLREERDRLTASQVDTAQADSVLAERDRLLQQVQALQNEISVLRRGTVAPEARPSSQSAAVPATPLSRQGATSGETARPRITFPGFDTNRLTNLDEVTAEIESIALPAGLSGADVSGEVLVLFQTDPEGNVIRTAAASRIGRGLDEVAEALVQAMRFVPPVVDGQPTGLRSQVSVRFGR